MKRSVLILTLLAGCASAPGGFDPSKLNADQLKALAAEKDATISCGLLTSVYGRGVAVYVNFDKGTIPANGTITIDAECKTTVTLSKPAAAASAASAP